MRIDLGGGAGYPIAGFVRVDVSGGDVTHDLRNTPYPFGDCEAEIIHCSHTLEHLCKSDAMALLGESYRILESDGLLTLAVPNMDIYIDAHLRNDFSGIVGCYDLNYCVGDTVPADSHWRHKYLWSFEALAYVLANTGFVNIVQHQHSDGPFRHLFPGHAYNPDFAPVSLYLDAVKP